MFAAHGFAQSWTWQSLSIYIPKFKLTEPSRPWWYPVLRAPVGSCTSCSDSLSGPRVTQKFSVYHSPAVPPAQPDEGTLLLTQWPPTLHLCLIPPRNKTGKKKKTKKLVATHSVHPEINFLFNPAPPCYYAHSGLLGPLDFLSGSLLLERRPVLYSTASALTAKMDHLSIPWLFYLPPLSCPREH